MNVLDTFILFNVVTVERSNFPFEHSTYLTIIISIMTFHHFNKSWLRLNVISAVVQGSFLST